MNLTGGNLSFIERNISNLQQIVPYLPKSIATVSSLNLHGNRITRVEGFPLTDSLASSTLQPLLCGLRTLDLSSNSIRSFEQLAGLRICQRLTRLNMACNELINAQPHLLGRQVLRYIPVLCLLFCILHRFFHFYVLINLYFVFLGLGR